VSGVVADTSVWIDFLSGRPARLLEDALARASVALPPIVVAELISGAHRAKDRRGLLELLGDLPLSPTPRAHWIRVGELRRALRARGLSVSTPDAHVAQCALDADALLLARDVVFERMAAHCELRVANG